MAIIVLQSANIKPLTHSHYLHLEATSLTVKAVSHWCWHLQHMLTAI